MKEICVNPRASAGKKLLLLGDMKTAEDAEDAEGTSVPLIYADLHGSEKSLMKKSALIRVYQRKRICFCSVQ